MTDKQISSEELTEELTLEEQVIDAEAQKELDREALLEKAGKRLDFVFGEKDSTPESESEKKPESTPESELESDPQKTEPESEPEQKPADEDLKSVTKPADDEKTKLTDAEIRAAKHNEWTDEEIKDFAKSNPELAKKTFAKMLASTNTLSKRFAELGKITKEKQERTQQSTSVKKDELIKSKIQPIDITSLEKDYADDPILGVIKKQNEQLIALGEKLETFDNASVTSANKVDEATVKTQVREDAAIAQQIDMFFKGSSVISYKDFYGEVSKDAVDWDDLTQKQLKHRMEVIETANLILFGAEAQGVDMTLDTALERAHLLATDEVREQIIRNKIKSEVKKRSDSLTLEPSNSSPLANSGKPDKKTVLARAGESLRKVFGTG